MKRIKKNVFCDSELYTVIKFIENNIKLFDCIPDNWFTNENKDCCFWPPPKGKNVAVRALKKELPDDTWQTYDCEVVKGGFATYALGRALVREKCLQAYNTSSAEEQQEAAKFRREHPGLTFLDFNFEDVFEKKNPLKTSVGNEEKIKTNAASKDKKGANSGTSEVRENSQDVNAGCHSLPSSNLVRGSSSAQHTKSRYKNSLPPNQSSTLNGAGTSEIRENSQEVNTGCHSLSSDSMRRSSSAQHTKSLTLNRSSTLNGGGTSEIRENSQGVNTGCHSLPSDSVRRSSSAQHTKSLTSNRSASISGTGTSDIRENSQDVNTGCHSLSSDSMRRSSSAQHTKSLTSNRSSTLNGGGNSEIRENSQGVNTGCHSLPSDSVRRSSSAQHTKSLTSNRSASISGAGTSEIRENSQDVNTGCHSLSSDSMRRSSSAQHTKSLTSNRSSTLNGGGTSEIRENSQGVNTGCHSLPSDSVRRSSSAQHTKSLTSNRSASISGGGTSEIRENSQGVNTGCHSLPSGSVRRSSFAQHTKSLTSNRSASISGAGTSEIRENSQGVNTGCHSLPSSNLLRRSSSAQHTKSRYKNSLPSNRCSSISGVGTSEIRENSQDVNTGCHSPSRSINETVCSVYSSRNSRCSSQRSRRSERSRSNISSRRSSQNSRRSHSRCSFSSTIRRQISGRRVASPCKNSVDRNQTISCSSSSESKILMKNVMKYVADLSETMNKNHQQNDRRLSRMEVSINKTLVRLGDITRSNASHSINDEPLSNFARDLPRRIHDENRDNAGESSRRFLTQQERRLSENPIQESHGEGSRRFLTQRERRMSEPDMPIANLDELADVNQQLKHKEFFSFLVNQEMEFCVPSQNVTLNVVVTNYLKRFISLRARSLLTLIGGDGLTLHADFHCVYRFLIEVFVEGYKYCNKSLTRKEAHEALRIVWGRSKQLLNDQKKSGTKSLIVFKNMNFCSS